MIPPLVRRCPDCGYLGFGPRFPVEERDGEPTVVCPRCGARVGRPLDPRLR